MYREQVNLLVNQVLILCSLPPCIIPSCSRLFSLCHYIINYLMSPCCVIALESKFIINGRYLISLLQALAYIIPASHDILMVWFCSIFCKLLSQECSLPYNIIQRSHCIFLSSKRSVVGLSETHVCQLLCCTIILYRIDSTRGFGIFLSLIDCRFFPLVVSSLNKSTSFRMSYDYIACGCHYLSI